MDMGPIHEEREKLRERVTELGNLAAEWETRANCATAEVERLTAELAPLRAAMDTLDATTATLRADLEQAQAQLREASMTAALEAQTSADLRRVNDVLRAQLADTDDVRRYAAEALRQAEAEVERLRAEVADVRTFANFEAAKAQDFARQLREAQHRVEWVTHPDGRRTLVRRSIVVEELAEVGALDVSIPHSVSYGYAVDRISGTGQHSDPRSGQEQALCAAQRIVETLTGVRP